MNIEAYAKKHPKARQGVILPENIAAIEQMPGGARILDIGCAEGHTLRHLRALFPDKFELVGVELSETRVQKAREANIDRAVFHHGDAQDLPIENGTIDFVLASQVIEHVSDDTKMLQEVERVLVPGGKFQIDTVYKKRWAKYIYHSPSGWALDPTHLREYTDVDALAAQFPPALKIDSILLQKTYRRLNIIRSLSFLPNWMKLRIPGYYGLFLSGHKAAQSPD